MTITWWGTLISAGLVLLFTAVMVGMSFAIRGDALTEHRAFEECRQNPQCKLTTHDYYLEQKYQKARKND